MRSTTRGVSSRNERRGLKSQSWPRRVHWPQLGRPSSHLTCGGGAWLAGRLGCGPRGAGADLAVATRPAAGARARWQASRRRGIGAGRGGVVVPRRDYGQTNLLFPGGSRPLLRRHHQRLHRNHGGRRGSADLARIGFTEKGRPRGRPTASRVQERRWLGLTLADRSSMARWGGGGGSRYGIDAADTWQMGELGGAGSLK